MEAVQFRNLQRGAEGWEIDTRRFIVLKVDFDTQQGDVRALNAQSQSTLIAFKGTKETIRSAGDTNQASIAALLKSAL